MWFCSQIGAREHYAIPRALQSSGRLERLYTDLRRAGLDEIDSRRVTTFPMEGLRWWWKLRRNTSYESFVENGQWFSRRVVNQLKGIDLENQTFFGYDTGFLEAGREVRLRGGLPIVGQMDPGPFEFRIVNEERERWPGWEDHQPPVPQAYNDRREEEWEVAEHIIVNSDWSRHALIEQGVAADKLKVIPLCYEPPEIPSQERKTREVDDPFVVLWLGQVNLRKGIPYLLEAARRLQGTRVQFRVVGPVKISPVGVDAATANVSFEGPVKRALVSDIYRDADLFVLPTLSDGFAITQLEAMAHGLPVIATPNCGRVVEDGLNGFVIPVRDAEALASRILTLAENREQWSEMSAQALATSKRFTLANLAQSLQSLEG